MSLLASINERNNVQSQETNAQAVQEMQDSAGPDAGDQARSRRSDYSNMVASAPDQEMQEEGASPEEQAVFTKLEKQMAEFIYGDSSNDMLKAVKAAQDPVEGIGQVAFDMVSMLSQQNPDTDDEILAALGESAVEMAVDMVESEDPNIDLTEDQMAEAYSLAVQNWMSAHPDQVDDDMKDYMAQAAPQQV